MPTIYLDSATTGFDEFDNGAYYRSRQRAVECHHCGKPARKTWTIVLDYHGDLLHFHASHCRLIDY